MRDLLLDESTPAQDRLLRAVFSDDLPDQVVHRGLLLFVQSCCEEVATSHPDEDDALGLCLEAIEAQLQSLHLGRPNALRPAAAQAGAALQQCLMRYQVMRQLVAASLPGQDALERRWEQLTRVARFAHLISELPFRRATPVSPARNGLFALNAQLYPEEREALCLWLSLCMDEAVAARERLVSLLKRWGQWGERRRAQEHARLEEGLF